MPVHKKELSDFLVSHSKNISQHVFLVCLQEQIPKICCRSTLQSYRRRHTISEGSKFTELDIGLNDLSQVDPSLLVNALTKLQILSVKDAKLTQQQAVAILSSANVESKLT